jgi:hypothetical protein
MNSASTRFKLAELRVKTDQELSQIIDNNLESALNFALTADGQRDASDLDSAEPQRVRAEKAYAEALKLLPKVDDLHERRRLKTKLEQVRKSLERLSTADESPRLQAFR